MKVARLLILAGVFAVLASDPVLAKDWSNPIIKDPGTGLYTYQAVVPAEGADAVELMSRARGWAAVAYASAQHVVQLDDPVGQRLVLKGNVQVSRGWTAYVPVNHTLTIEAKDGRYRYILTDFAVAAYSVNGQPVEGTWWEKEHKFWERLDVQCRALLDGLQAAMTKPTPAADKGW